MAEGHSRANGLAVGGQGAGQENRSREEGAMDQVQDPRLYFHDSPRHPRSCFMNSLGGSEAKEDDTMKLNGDSIQGSRHRQEESAA